MMEKIVCSGCKVEHTDVESVEQAKKWIADGYAPCPNLGCQGEFKLVNDD